MHGALGSSSKTCQSQPGARLTSAELQWVPELLLKEPDWPAYTRTHTQLTSPFVVTHRGRHEHSQTQMHTHALTQTHTHTLHITVMKLKWVRLME